MKDNFENNKDLAKSNLVDVPDKWQATQEDIQKAYDAKSEKFLKHKKKFENID